MGRAPHITDEAGHPRMTAVERAAPAGVDAGAQLLRCWIEDAAERHPDKPYICSVDDGRTITFGQLRQLTRRIATLLRSRDIEANDRIALLSANSIEHLACYFGVMAYGATICTIHVEMNRRHLDNILTRNSRCAHGAARVPLSKDRNA